MTPEQKQHFRELRIQAQALQEQTVSFIKSLSFTLERDYIFDNHVGGQTTLTELFGDKDDLVVIHNMGKDCVYCTMWGDEVNGVLDHLRDRTSIVMVNADPVDVQMEFKALRSWEFPMFCDSLSEFTNDMGFLVRRDGEVFLNPGFSTFHRNGEGQMTRVGFDFFGPGDLYSAPWHYFDLLEGGAGEWEPKYRYGHQTVAINL